MYTYTAPGHLPRRQLRVRRGLWLVRRVGGEHGAGRGQIPQAGAWRCQWAVERGQGARRPRRLEWPLLQPAARFCFVFIAGSWPLDLEGARRGHVQCRHLRRKESVGALHLQRNGLIRRYTVLLFLDGGGASGQSSAAIRRYTVLLFLWRCYFSGDAISLEMQRAFSTLLSYSVAADRSALTSDKTVTAAACFGLGGEALL